MPNRTILPPPPPCAACAARWESLLGLAGAAERAEQAPAAGASPPPPPPQSQSLPPPFILDAARGHYSLCDVQRLASEAAALCAEGPTFFWIPAKGSVYRVPREWAERVHPGGSFSLASHAGKDSSMDFDFHSSQAHKVWAKFREGSLQPCTPSACSIT